jgi:hypothetical protein
MRQNDCNIVAAREQVKKETIKILASCFAFLDVKDEAGGRVFCMPSFFSAVNAFFFSLTHREKAQ